MRRRLFTFLSATSLVLCIGISLMWARSFHAISDWGVVAWNFFGLRSARGSVEFQYVTWESAPGNFIPWPSDDPRLKLPGTKHQDRHFDFVSSGPLRHRRFTDVDRIDLRFLRDNGFLRPVGAVYGFAWTNAIYDLNPTNILFLPLQTNRRTYQERVAFRSVRVPYWFVEVCALASPLLLALRVLVERRRIANHQCRACGYALPPMPVRCPKCGTEIDDA